MINQNPLKNPECYEHILAEARRFDAMINDVFWLPGAAELRTQEAADEFGEDHGDFSDEIMVISFVGAGLLRNPQRHLCNFSVDTWTLPSP